MKGLHYRTISRMLEHLEGWIAKHPFERPHFVVPPPEYHVVAPLDCVRHIVARDEPAKALLDAFCKIGVLVGGPGAEPTIEMLQVVLKLAHMPAEVVPLERFGRVTGIVSPGSSAKN